MTITNPLVVGRPITVKEEGVPIMTNVGSFDFTGAGISGSALGSEVTENVPGATGGVTSLNGETGSSQTFAKVNDTNVTLNIGSSSNTHTFTLGWTGTLPIARGGTGLGTLGTANQLIRVNSGASALEYFTPGFLSAAITSLNGLTAASQTFANDTNVTISSATSTHTITWSGTLAVARGGTGLASATAYAVLCGGTTSTGAFQSIASVGTSGQVLTSNGAGALPTFQTVGGGSSNITIGTTPIVSGTANRLLVHSDSGDVVQEDSALTWNFTTNALTIDTAVFSRPSAGTLYAGSFPASIVSPNNGTVYGMGAAPSVTTATNYVAIGQRTAEAATTQQSFVYLGNFAGLNAVGTRNFGGGASALANNAGTDCYGLGSLSMVNATGEVGSIFIGTNTGVGATTGFWQTFIGDAAGGATGSSWGNTYIGGRGGQTIGNTFGSSRNTVAGYASDADAGLTGTIGFGAGVTVKTSNTAIFGGTISNISIFYFGRGETDAAANTINIQATGGSGTDNQGAGLRFATGRSTGNVPGGDMFFAISQPGTSGTTLRALTDIAKFTYLQFQSLTNGSFLMPVAAGIVTAPTYSFLNDSNTGMWSSAADNIDFTTGGTNRLNVDANGNLRAATVHNNATAQGSATQQDIRSGTYTPTRSAEANLDANVTPSQAQWMRIGNVVTVSGRFTADPTLPATATSFELSLPVASNIGAVEDCSGVAFCGNIAAQGAGVTGSVANNTAVITWVSGDTTSQSWSYTYTYEVI